ncbi:hypothetical protein MNEG_12250 [Monoraphidium neglectum]|uniref:Uncharacterized protein n=1 Tax=Monoraphidium neglectum TaxID=145388 RepID=A0A0D2KIV2_9CHLO|nr:hypothetical protein MNEG_12250 [Monoraphidium neglectum]KIY95713.1 hypothetical protein MNEG_12250 [Monoraphidium neglectum]|eukprot:XP_013894733.1 hypothetical protein MNEG_12250 [Monoraphidium neglectum]
MQVSTRSLAPSRPARGQLQTCHAATGVRQQVAAAAAAAALLVGGAAAPLPAAAFGPVKVKLENIQVTQVPCDTGVGTVGGVTFSGARSKAACLDVGAQATNPESKPLFNADVFGRIYDANQEAMIDDNESIRIAYIDEIPPGKSEVHFKLFVPLEQYKLGKPTLTGFKATGFPGGNLPKTGPGKVDAQQLSDCEILGDCEDLELEAAIR